MRKTLKFANLANQTVSNAVTRTFVISVPALTTSTTEIVSASVHQELPLLTDSVSLVEHNVLVALDITTVSPVMLDTIQTATENVLPVQETAEFATMMESAQAVTVDTCSRATEAVRLKDGTTSGGSGLFSPFLLSDSWLLVPVCWEKLDQLETDNTPDTHKITELTTAMPPEVNMR